MIPLSYLRAFCILSFILGIYSPLSTAAPIPRGPADPDQCAYDLQRFTVGSIGGDNPFVAAGDENTYIDGSLNGALTLRVAKPKDGGAVGAAELINSTFLFPTKGKVTVDAEIHTIKGIVAGVMLVGEEYGPEIDLLVTGRDTDVVQSNIFNTPLGEPRVYDLFDGTTSFNGTLVTDRNIYEIEWNDKAINATLINSRGVRVTRQVIKVPEYEHMWPNKPMRARIGIWDTSADANATRWAGGPVDWANWDQGKDNIKMVIYSIKTEC